MEPRLFEASRSGHISAFHSLLGEDPFLLDRVALNSVDNPLHISTLAGQTEITKAIVSRKPAFARELNENGFSPMHVASAKGHIEIIRELMRVGYDICLLKGKDGKVPLHCAALKGRVDVVKELVGACPESVKEPTAFGETALHLAVKSNQIEAARVLIEEMRRLDMMEILNWKDKDGNTILHQATFNRQHEASFAVLPSNALLNPGFAHGGVQSMIIGLLIGQEAVVSRVNVNAINSSGFTPKDVLDLLLQSGGDCYDIQIHQIFQQAGAVKARDITTGPAHVQTEAENFNKKQKLLSPSSWNQWKELMKEVTESSTDTQNALMVVAVLIATITYQAILSPPSGFWSDPDNKNLPTASTVQKRTMEPGEAVMSDDPPIFSVLIVFNTIGFIASVAMIFLLTSGFPLRAGLRLAMFSMIGTYVVAISYIGPTKMTEIYITVIVMGILFLAEFARFIMWLFKKWRVGPDTRRKH
ncbi:Ankyrin repeat family protein [Theobroma cacao]|uniref:Ankyrin repeat family protein n=1 Tax=Theobroma cacao TaxID=3641 RepID=A0A061DVU4_THECC|nr:Ankyrin repeat family protein [Theobroma cacao]